MQVYRTGENLWTIIQTSLGHKVCLKPNLHVSFFSGFDFSSTSFYRFHLIETHMTFSPFQCDRCKRVYTRKSLYTRHLKEVPQDSSTARRTRQCPHRLVEQDESSVMAQTQRSMESRVGRKNQREYISPLVPKRSTLTSID